jgi:hypothetical protein
MFEMYAFGPPKSIGEFLSLDKLSERIGKDAAIYIKIQLVNVDYPFDELKSDVDEFNKDREWKDQIRLHEELPKFVDAPATLI